MNYKIGNQRYCELPIGNRSYYNFSDALIASEKNDNDTHHQLKLIVLLISISIILICCIIKHWAI